jgi:hypothetical protein
MLLKKSLFLAYLLISYSAMAAPADPVRRADSLFASGRSLEAAGLYETALTTGHATDAMLLKLAYVNEQQNDVPRLLYYLQVYQDRHPDSAVLRKMNDIARVNGLSGYETDDLNYFLLFYKQFGLYVVLLLLLPALYVFAVMVQKVLRRDTTTPPARKWVLLLYLLALLTFVNLPEGYQSGIVSHDRVLLREQPSAAAPVIDVIGRGHKVNILGRQDIYLRVLWNNRLYYLRQDQVWLI